MALICLGCGAEQSGDDCEACYARLARCVSIFAHWPVELTLSVAALYHIETAIRAHIASGEPHTTVTELSTAANNIRAYLQHVAAGQPHYTDTITDEELLS